MEERAKNCTICSKLKDREYTFTKYLSDYSTPPLPDAAARLVVVIDMNPGSSRASRLMRCPECGTYYLYESDYEYLVNGTEDEEFLTRLTDEQAGEYLSKY